MKTAAGEWRRQTWTWQTLTHRHWPGGGLCLSDEWGWPPEWVMDTSTPSLYYLRNRGCWPRNEQYETKKKKSSWQARLSDSSQYFMNAFQMPFWIAKKTAINQTANGDNVSRVYLESLTSSFVCLDQTRLQTWEPVSTRCTGSNCSELQIRMLQSAEPPPEASRLRWCGDQAMAFTAPWCSLNVCNGIGESWFHTSSWK